MSITYVVLLIKYKIMYGIKVHCLSSPSDTPAKLDCLIKIEDVFLCDDSYIICWYINGKASMSRSQLYY